MRKIALLTALLGTSVLFLSSLFAQDHDLYMGPEYIDEAQTLPPSIVGFDQTGYYVFQNKRPVYLTGLIPIKLSREKVYLRKFDKRLKPTQTAEINPRYKGKRENPEFSFMANGRMFVFSTYVERSKRQTLLFSREVDLNTMTIPREGNLIASASFDGFPRDKNVEFFYEMSRDSSKILIHYQLPNKRNNPERFAVHAFTSDMIALWKREFSLPYAEGLFDIRRFLIDNEANAYLLGKNYRERAKERVNGLPNYDFKLLELNPSFEQPEEYTLQLPGKFLVDMHLEVLRNGDLVCAGVFAEDRSFKIKGIYYFIMDGQTAEVKHESAREMSLSMFEDEGDKPKKKKKRQAERAFYNYDFRDIVLRSDGGAVLIGEERYSRTYSRYVANGTGGGYYTYYTIFYRNDLLAIDIGPDGDIEQAFRVPKRQQQTDSDILLSYAMAVAGGKIRFVFNDRAENLELRGTNLRPKTYTPSGMRRARQVVELVSLDMANGDYEREALTTAKEADQYALPYASVQVAPNELILLFQRGKRRRMARVTF